jgi:hypothetical protein
LLWLAVLGGAMLWRVFVLIVTTLLFGCARDGLDFPSVTQTNGAPKNGQARIVVLLEKGYSGVFDSGYPVALDGEPMGELKMGTFLFRDRPAGRHELSVDLWDFPGVTKQEITVAPGRTYFFLTRMSARGKAITAGSFAGLAGIAVTAVATSGESNQGPVEFVPLNDAAGRQAISELRLAK